MISFWSENPDSVAMHFQTFVEMDGRYKPLATWATRPMWILLNDVVSESTN